MANADVARLIGVWMDSWSNGPGTNPHWYENWKITPALQPLKQQVIGNVAGVLWVVMATIGLVLLIACTNLANLLLVRAESRQMELSIRAALGAGRFRIARELLLESVTLGLMGGALAVGVAYAGLRFLVALGPANLPRLTEISLDARSIGFTFGSRCSRASVLGLIPAVKYAWTRHELAGTGGRTASASRERHRSRNVLVVAQVAMSLVLLVSATLMIRTFARMRRVDPGFADARTCKPCAIAIPESLVPDPTMVMRTENAIAGQARGACRRQRRGICERCADGGNRAELGQMSTSRARTTTMTKPPLRLFDYVSPGYFTPWERASWRAATSPGTTSTECGRWRWSRRALRARSGDRPRRQSASAIRQFDKMPWQEVIGVVQDVRQNGVDQKAPAMVYWGAMIQDPYTPKPTIGVERSVTFAVHSANAGTEGFLNEVQQAVWSVNANLPVASPQTMQEIYDASMARTSFTLVMLAIAGSMALLLGIVGHLWRDRLCSGAAAARDRDPAGAGRPTARAALDVCAVGAAADGRWRSAGPGGGGGTDAADEVAAVRDQPDRSADLCGGGCRAGWSGGGGKLFAGAAGGGGESGRGAAGRVAERIGASVSPEFPEQFNKSKCAEAGASGAKAHPILQLCGTTEVVP